MQIYTGAIDLHIIYIAMYVHFKAALIPRLAYYAYNSMIIIFLEPIAVTTF